MKFCDVSDPASLDQQAAHPLGAGAKVLLVSVFGPYAIDDEYGSRAMNPMELYHNQVTRVQGPFSLRMFHRSCGLMMIQANISAPCTLLDYPDLDRFIMEIRGKDYDVIGISAIPQNVKKVKEMCSLIREHQPGASIAVGGHIANIKDPQGLFDADILVRGEGVRWFRRFLGEDENQPVNHPQILSATKVRCMGLDLPINSRMTAAVLIPSVGCPLGCNFCSTSAMFGGKGKYVNFYETGEELFDVMCGLEKEMGVRSFFVMDDNFLLQRRRALRLLELIKDHEKTWSLFVFGSADALRNYNVEQLVGLGISWLWLGLEGKDSRYGKLMGADTQSLVRTLQANGIRIMGSTMIGLENHKEEDIDEAIEWAVGHKTDFHQFMLYTPAHGTPLRKEYDKRGLLLEEPEIEEADIHGQYRFNYRHQFIERGREGELITRAFQRDFEENGPSVIRMLQTLLDGWLEHKNHPEWRIRKRFAMEADKLPTFYAAFLWAAARWYKDDPKIRPPILNTLERVYREFGLRSRVAAPVLGRIVLYFLYRENKRMLSQHAYEPPTVYSDSVESVKPSGKRVHLKEVDHSPDCLLPKAEAS